MDGHKSYFFCGIGGSGMLPLAVILRSHGHDVAGSDRTLDQGRLGAKFAWLQSRGIPLHQQDGTGLRHGQILVTSAAVEDTVPDVAAAHALGLERLSRPQLLAELFNAASFAIAVGGTSGKSTTTGMIGWILHASGRDPTVMNGAVMKNFLSSEAPFASALVGRGDAFVSEVDESDGSIALYRPAIAVLGNITLDHKSLDELRSLFGDFARRAHTTILNLDDEETRRIAATLPREKIVTFSFSDPEADLIGGALIEEPLSIAFAVTDRSSGEAFAVRLHVPGRHNAENALAALAAARAAGVPLREAAEALSGFTGLKRRFDVVGTANQVTIIDDFGHNPDKIAATLRTLHAFPGRLLLYFQPHGYGPLKVMKNALIACFAKEMAAKDMLFMSDPVYFGGTTDRSVGSEDIVAGVSASGRTAHHASTREAITAKLIAEALPGDRVIVMGARDDTLSTFAQELVEALAIPSAPHSS